MKARVEGPSVAWEDYLDIAPEFLFLFENSRPKA
jgi:hypothetical protein